jgi:hypothetical protein
MIRGQGPFPKGPSAGIENGKTEGFSFAYPARGRVGNASLPFLRQPLRDVNPPGPIRRDSMPRVQFQQAMGFFNQKIEIHERIGCDI